MRTLEELEVLVHFAEPGIIIEASELMLLVQNFKWATLWKALEIGTIVNDDLGLLKRIQDNILSAESDPARKLRFERTTYSFDQQPWITIWKNKIIPYLTLKEQFTLSRVNKFFFRISSEIYELKDEFPLYLEGLFDSHSSINDGQFLLNQARQRAYPDEKNHLAALFEGIVKYLTPKELIMIGAIDPLSDNIEETRKPTSYIIEEINAITLGLIQNNLVTTLFLLSHIKYFSSKSFHNIIESSCKYGAKNVVEFFMWAFHNNDLLKTDFYFTIACDYYQIEIIKLLIPRTNNFILILCLATLENRNGPNSQKIIDFMKQYGITIPFEIRHSTDKYNCNSEIVNDIIQHDCVIGLKLHIGLCKIKYSTLLYSIMQKKYIDSSLPLNIIAFLLRHQINIQTHQDVQKSFSKFICYLSTSDKLNIFLKSIIPTHNATLLPSTHSKLITAVCRAAHIENLRVLIDYGIDINSTFSSKKHVLTSPLSRTVFNYQKTQNVFNFLIEEGAIFTQLAACHAIEGNQLAALEALLRLPNAVIHTDSLDYHPLFVAAQFGRLECFRYLLSNNVNLENLSFDQLWEMLVQGTIAGIFQLSKSEAKCDTWLGPLYNMRAKLLKKMYRVEIGNKYGFPEANPFEFPHFLNEKSAIYLEIVMIILPFLKDRIYGNNEILPIAVYTGNVNLVLQILAYSPALDSDGRCCISIAVQQQNLEMLNILLKYGAMVSDDRKISSLLHEAYKNYEILAALINSKQYALLNFPSFPNKDRCRCCLEFLQDMSCNPINPFLAKELYDRYQLHPEMTLLQEILKIIEDNTLGEGWSETGFSRIAINNTSHFVPGIIAEIYSTILSLYKLPFSDAIYSLSTTYITIHNLANHFTGFKLRIHSSKTINICSQILKLISEKISKNSYINNNLKNQPDH